MTDKSIIAYASRTGTRKTLRALRKGNWRLLVSATGCHRDEGFPYAIDNGAWTAFQKGLPFDVQRFVEVVRKLGARADWIVAPDIVGAGYQSLSLSLKWLPWVLDRTPRAMIAVQDGMLPESVADFLGPRVGIFVGGSTDWKLATIPVWGNLGRLLNVWTHVGRVNTARRIHLCRRHGITSFDGTSVTRYLKTLPLLERARHESLNR